MKKVIGLYLFFVLLLIFIIGNYSASMYGKELFSFFIYKLPYDLKVSKVDAKYAIYNSKTELAIIFPEEKFTLNETIFVDEIEKICEYEKFIAIQVRTNEHKIKILTIWRENDMLKSNVYAPEEFYSSNSNVLYCVGLEHVPYIVKLWKVLGMAIIISLILIAWITFRTGRGLAPRLAQE